MPGKPIHYQKTMAEREVTPLDQQNRIQHAHVAPHNLRVHFYPTKKYNNSNTEFFNIFTKLLNISNDTHTGSLPPKSVHANARVNGRSDDEIRRYLNNPNGHIFARHPCDSTIPAGALLPDSQPTDTLECDASQLPTTRKVHPPMSIHSNGCSQSYHQQGPLLGTPDVSIPAWYRPDSIANVLARPFVRKLCRVTMNTATRPAIIAHDPMHFIQQTNGLCLYCPSNTAFPASGKHSKFTQHEAKGANTARDLHRKTDRSSPVRLELPLANGFINNLPTDSTTTSRTKETVKNKGLLTPHDNAIPLPADPHQPTESGTVADCGTALLADLHQPIEDGTMAGLHQHIEDGPVDLTMLADPHEHIEDGPVDLLSKNGQLPAKKERTSKKKEQVPKRKERVPKKKDRTPKTKERVPKKKERLEVPKSKE